MKRQNLKKKAARGSRANRSAPKKRRKVSVELSPKVVFDTVKVWAEGAQDLQDVVAYYRRELDGHPDKVFYISSQDALVLLAGTVPLNFKVGGFEMVLRYTESLGWFLESGL